MELLHRPLCARTASGDRTPATSWLTRWSCSLLGFSYLIAVLVARNQAVPLADGRLLAVGGAAAMLSLLVLCG
jgi:hypothetical protein